MKVMQENHLDALVRLHTSLPPGQDRLSRVSRGPPTTLAASRRWVRTPG